MHTYLTFISGNKVRTRHSKHHTLSYRPTRPTSLKLQANKVTEDEMKLLCTPTDVLNTQI